MTGEKFNKRYNTTDNKLEELEEKYYAQNIIESDFSKYVELEEKEFKNFREEKLYETMLENILDLGIEKRGIEYIKCGYSYSMIKIKSNLKKLIINSIENFGIENITVKNKIYILVLAILRR